MKVYNEYQALNKLINAMSGVFSKLSKAKCSNYEKYGLFITTLERTLTDIDLERNFIPSLKKMEVQDFHKILNSDSSKQRFYLYLWIKGVTL